MYTTVHVYYSTDSTVQYIGLWPMAVCMCRPQYACTQSSIDIEDSGLLDLVKNKMKSYTYNYANLSITHCNSLPPPLTNCRTLWRCARRRTNSSASSSPSSTSMRWLWSGGSLGRRGGTAPIPTTLGTSPSASTCSITTWRPIIRYRCTEIIEMLPYIAAKLRNVSKKGTLSCEHDVGM